MDFPCRRINLDVGDNDGDDDDNHDDDDDNFHEDEDLMFLCELWSMHVSGIMMMLVTMTKMKMRVVESLKMKTFCLSALWSMNVSVTAKMEKNCDDVGDYGEDDD